jgi:hypothetical protein
MSGAQGRAFAFVFLATMLLLAAPAWSATRFASPTGDASAAMTCPPGDECDIQTAVEDPSVDPGDEVILLPGDYGIGGNSIRPAVAIDLHGTGQPAPRLLSTGNGSGVDIDIPGVIVRDLRIEHSSGSGVALDIQAASTADRVIASSSSNIACLPALGALIRDSICHSTAADQAAVRFFYNGTDGPSTANLINVTAIASTGDSNGIELGTFDVGEQTLNATNVIAAGSGTAPDVAAFDNGTSVTINLEHSNYDTENQGTGTTITDPGSGTNQIAAPQFSNPAAGDFHQAPGSPTIDAGTGDPLLGSLDIDGESRTQGAAPDIGADEFAPPGPEPAANGDRFPPDTKILKGPRKRTEKRKAKFQFGGSEPGLTFECSLDGKEFKPCASPEKYRSLKRTKHEFVVRSVDAAGNRDPSPADRKWSIKKKKHQRKK